LVYVEATTGIRHVGQRISSFMSAGKRRFFVRCLISNTGIFTIQQLFNKACLGFSFYGETKKIVSLKLDSMHRQSKFDRLLSLLDVLQLMANSDEVIKLNEQDTNV
jgi:hypothetical protein